MPPDIRDGRIRVSAAKDKASFLEMQMSLIKLLLTVWSVHDHRVVFFTSAFALTISAIPFDTRSCK